MKNVCLLVVSVVLIVVWSCATNSVDFALEEICVIADKEPERAQIMLDSMQNSIKSLSNEEKYYIRLLRIKCDDKLYVTHTSDSVILEVIDYYQNSGNQRRLMTALYYGGRVYRDMGDSPRALRYMQQALDLAEEVDAEDMKSLIYSQMGQLYVSQHIYDLAKTMFEQTIQHSLIIGDSVAVILDLLELGGIYSCKQQYDSAIIVQNKALGLAKGLGSNNYIGMASRQLANSYMHQDRFYLALDILNSIPFSEENHNNPTHISLMSQYHWNIYNRDSSIIYANRMIENGTLSHKMTAHARLAWIAMEEANPKDAISHLDSYILLRDSIEAEQNSESTRRIGALYDYSIRERENAKLKIDDKNKQLVIIILSVCVLFLVIIMIVAWRYDVAKKTLTEIRLKSLKHVKEHLHRKSQEGIEDNVKEIAKLDETLQTVTKAKDQFSANIEHQKLMLLNAIEKAQEEIRYKQAADEQISSLGIITDIKAVLAHESHPNLSVELWQKFKSEVNLLYPEFFPILDNLPHKLSDFEYEVSLLIKIRFAPSDIAILTNHSKEAISSSRRRLYKKVFMKSGSPKDWDNFILSI